MLCWISYNLAELGVIEEFLRLIDLDQIRPFSNLVLDMN